MKYLVILDFTESKNPPPVEQVDLCTATCYDSLNDANEGINNLTAAKIVTALRRKKAGSSSEYEIKIFGKYDGIIKVVAYPDDMVFYDIAVNDIVASHETTYRYTRLDLALDFVNRVTGAVGELRFKLPFGLIVSDDRTISIKLDLDIVNKQSVAIVGDDDYETIGANGGMSQAEIKQAYHKKILDVHPDRGGKAEDFVRVQQAYERIKNGTPRRKRKKVKTRVIRSYTCKGPVDVLSHTIALEELMLKRRSEASMMQSASGRATGTNTFVDVIWDLMVRLAVIVILGIIGSIIGVIRGD